MEKIKDKIKRIVIKVGSSLLTSQDGKFYISHLKEIIKEIIRLKEDKIEVVIVSSGAIAAGAEYFNLSKSGIFTSMPLRQAAAALGQVRLMQIYKEIFSDYNLEVAQVLVTHGDLSCRLSYLHISNTLRTLIENNVIPIINENDSVGIEEIKFGDNDRLAAAITRVIEADFLFILTDTPGIYIPKVQMGKNKRSIDYLRSVGELTEERLLDLKNKVKDEGITTKEKRIRFSRGGVETKLEAAYIATQGGAWVAIIDGKQPQLINKILCNIKKRHNLDQIEATIFLPLRKKLSARKWWLLYSTLPKGEIIVDDGAKEALIRRKSSLLPVGIKEIKGEFSAGEVVVIQDLQNNLLGRGVVNYSNSEISLIKGKKTKELASILGYKGYDEVIHRDNLSLSV
jgi:glutamate 5-kinase